MTRKDYIAIAAAIRATQQRIKEEQFRLRRENGRDLDVLELLQLQESNQLRGVRRAAAHIADALAEDNPRGFDPTLFLVNCGYGPITMNPRDPALDLRPSTGSLSHDHSG